jgi:hypothetical protein
VVARIIITVSYCSYRQQEKRQAGKQVVSTMFFFQVPFHISIIFGHILIQKGDAFHPIYTLKPPLSLSHSTSFQRSTVVSLQKPTASSNFGRGNNLWATITKSSEDAAVDSGPVESLSTTDVSSSTFLGPSIPYAKLTVGVLKETFSGENRVSQSPESIQKLVKAGIKVVVQAGGTYFPFKRKLLFIICEAC